MTLKEISKEYRRSALLLENRIKELEEQAAQSDAGTASRLRGRIEALRKMHRDTVELAAFTEHYHDKGYHSNVRIKA